MSLEQKKLEILRDILGSYTRHSDEYLFYCSCGHHKRKLSINLKKDVVKCWVCSWSAKSVQSVIFKYGQKQHVTAWKALNPRNVDFSTLNTEFHAKPRCILPKYYKFLLDCPETHSARVYLKNRGVSKEDIVRYRLGVCQAGEYAGRIIFPFFDALGDLNFFTSRTLGNHTKKYKNCEGISKNEIIPNELFIDWTKPITIVEGPIDYIKTQDSNCVPLLGSTLDSDSLLFQKIVLSDVDIFLGIDPDAKHKEYKIASEFCRYGVEVYKIPVKPYRDIGEMTKPQYKKQKEKAYLFCQNDITHKINSL